MRHVAALLLAPALLAAACAEPVPPTRASYVGSWQSPRMQLVITADGHVQYERREGNATRSVSGPIRRFEGDNFSVGFGPFSTTFVVSVPPHLEDGVWKMTVDGVELARRGGRPDDLRASA